MTRILILPAMLAMTIVTAIPAFAGPDCTCRHKGKDVPEGQSTCIKTSDGYKVAQCSRVLNNTSWKFTKKTCPVS